MATTINQYNVGLSLNAKDYIDKSRISAAETRKLTRDIEQARTPAERYSREHDRLTRAYQAGAISGQTYNRLLDAQKQKFEAANAKLSQHVSLMKQFSQVGNIITGTYHGIKMAIQTAMIPLRQMQDLWQQFDDVAKKIDEVQKSATKLGLSFNELAGLRLAAQEIAGSANALDNAISQMMRRGFGGADPMQSFLGFADEIEGMATQSERMQRAFEIFGRGGAEVVAMLQGGSSAIRESVEFQQRWNSLTDAQTLAVEQYNDTLNRVSIIIEGIKQTFVAELAPAVTMVLKDIVKMAEQFKIQEFTMRDVVNHIVIQATSWKEIAKAAMIVQFATTGQLDLAKKTFDSLQHPGEAALAAILKLEMERKKLENAADERQKKREQQRLQAMRDQMDQMETNHDAHERLWQEHMNNLERQFEQMSASALQQAEKFFEAERQRAMKMRQDVARGPTTMEVGSAAAVRFAAEQNNRALAVAAVPDRPTPGEKELLAKAKELYELNVRQNQTTQEQLTTLRALLDTARQNGFKRIR